MAQSSSGRLFGRLAIGVAVSALLVSACSRKPADNDAAGPAANADLAAMPVAPVDTSSAVKLASLHGDAANGATVFMACQACHSADPGVNRVGPTLHGVVGRKAGSIAGFGYSSAISGSGISWTPDRLFAFLEAPQRSVPGTRMSFAGLPDPQARADVIAYLQQQRRLPAR